MAKTPEEAYRIAEEMIKQALREQSLKLDLQGLGLTQVPESLIQLTQLRELKVGNNQLEVVPVFLGQLTRLFYLVIIGNRLRTLPESIGQLTQGSSRGRLEKCS
jgi:Leucine-rich repeat (LRR) protein